MDGAGGAGGLEQDAVGLEGTLADEGKSRDRPCRQVAAAVTG